MKRAITPPLLLSRDQGQMIPTAALAIVVITMLIFASLYVGAHLTQRRGLQNTADAAVLAGAQELNGTAASEAPAIAKAQEYIDAHVSNLSSPAEIVVADNYTSIKVTVRKKPNVSFGVIGDAVIAAKAKARIASPLLPGPGVVPVAIDETAYQACLNDPGGPACLDVTLKEYSNNNSDPASNYQLIDISGSGSSDVCDFLIGGSTNPITDPVDAQPGNQSNLHNCLVQRMNAAAATGGTHPPRCLTYDDVTDGTGLLREECNPLAGAHRGADANFPDAQPTAVVLLPVVKTFCNGSCAEDIVGDGPNTVRTFAFFLIDLSTVQTVDGVGPTCAPPSGGGNGNGNGTGQCWITGRFLLDYQAFLTINDGGNGTFDGDATTKVVELIE